MDRPRALSLLALSFTVLLAFAPFSDSLAGECQAMEFPAVDEETGEDRILPATVSAEVGDKLLKHACPVGSGEPDGLSPMSFGLTYYNQPVGAVYLSSKKGPDVFVNITSGMSSALGLWWCRYDGRTPEGNLILKKPVRVLPRQKGVCIRVFQDRGNIYCAIVSDNKIKILEWTGPVGQSQRPGSLAADQGSAAATGPNPAQDSKYFSLLKTIEWEGTGYSTLSIDFIRRNRNTIEMAILSSDNEGSAPETFKGDNRSLYDGSGIYRGTLPYGGLQRMTFDNDWNIVGSLEMVSEDLKLAIAPRSMSCVRDKGLDGYVVSTTLGALRYLPYQAGDKVKAGYLRTPQSSVLNHPYQGAEICVIPEGKARSRLLIGGQSAIYEYEFEGLSGPASSGSSASNPATSNLASSSLATSDTCPVYSVRTAVLERNAPLYSGSLTVPNVVDWDSDGALDIIAGNSEGRLLFFKNTGTNLNPLFLMGCEMEAGGKPIRFLPGYHIVQGPLEGAWGYLCPTVFDWNSDGLPDIVASGSFNNYIVMLNRGTLTEPQLDAPEVIRIDNMELFGTWRVRPAIARIDGEVYMLIMDDKNALHKYRRIDDCTVEDEGRVFLTDGRAITGHNNAGESMGQRGRAKMCLVDWDSDGDLDLLLGCVKRNAYPATDGIPYRRFLKKETGMQVLLFINEGKGADFVFREPGQILVDGKDFYLGAHSNAPVACMLGDTSDGPNLLVGCESGKFFFFEHGRLSTTR